MTPKEAVERLQAYRLKMNLNKSALAKMMGIPDGTLNAWLADPKLKSHRLPNKDGASRIAAFLGSVAAERNLLVEDAKFSKKSLSPITKKDSIRIQKETPERVFRLRYLFLLIAQDLDALRNANVQDRDLYRSALDSRDVGYLSSLMSMLCDEKQFQRWQQFTTYRFRQFKNTEE